MSAQGQPIRLVIADDHPIFREGLRRLLDAEPGFKVVGQAADGADALRCTRDLRPEILLLDLAMPKVGGLEVLRKLSEERVDVKVILLTAQINAGETVEALQHGARGVVLKESATQVLYKCVRAVMSGEYWVGHERVADIVHLLTEHRRRALAPPPALLLTARELQIVAAIVEGTSNKDISRQLGVSEQTVKNHLSHIFDKVGVSNRLELALYALHHNLVGGAPAGRHGGGQGAR